MAQIVTITNPLTGQPAQVDQLDHTAQQIDDAIARALPGGEIDITLANKAPAGYGLGGGATKTVETDFNNYIDNGVYQCPASFDSIQNAPPNGHYGMLIVSHGSNAIVQDVYGPSWGSSAIRWFHVRRVSTSSDGNADFWSEWEWPEPPMELGVEYRTTERYLGKPVYTRLFNCGNMPAAGTISTVQAPYNEDTNPISNAWIYNAFLTYYGQSLPMYVYGSTIGVSSGVCVNSSGLILIVTNGSTDLTNSNANLYVTLKYTKNTD